MKHFLKIVIFMIGLSACLAVLGPPQLCAQNSRHDRENGIKAGFIIGFSDFMKWENHSIDTSKELRIGLLGKGRLKDTLEKAIRAKSSHKRRIYLESFETPDQIDDVHILFVFKEEMETWEDTRLICGKKSILTISDIKDFASNGGMIEIVRVGNRIKFVVNNTVAKQSGIAISSKLIRLSHGGNR